MNTYIFNSTNKSINDRPFEVVETKGLGHPDNISDSLAEQISNDYSIYCMNKYGIVLRHMVDKLTVIGGSSKVQFGSGYMTKPIKVLLNGRFTDSFENEQINYYEIASKTIKNYFHYWTLIVIYQS